ncbi:hypothetical protein CPB85DRAFT_1285091 [Mucidula mucida]|nr:hypothetical protein CPB85DRAFT_1285091 [Mucidula mucida]
MLLGALLNFGVPRACSSGHVATFVLGGCQPIPRREIRKWRYQYQRLHCNARMSTPVVQDSAILLTNAGMSLPGHFLPADRQADQKIETTTASETCSVTRPFRKSSLTKIDLRKI